MIQENGKEYKVFEGDTLQKALNKLFSEGYEVASMKKVWELRENEKIPEEYYETNMIFQKGEIREAIKQEMLDLESLYNDGGRLIFLIDNYDGLGANSDLDDDGHFVGVRDIQQNKYCPCCVKMVEE